MNELQPLILAAGKGTRLGLESLPKPMVEVNGAPLMQQPVHTLYKMAFRDEEIIAVVGHKGGVIKQHFAGDLSYVEQEELNGNAGAILSFQESGKFMDDASTLIIQGDDAPQASLNNLQRLARGHERRSAAATVLAVSQPDTNSHKIEYICRDDRVITMHKRSSSDSHGRYTAGIYVFSNRALERYLPLLQNNTGEGQELGIFTILEMMLNQNERVYLEMSDQPYISLNTLEGVQRIRQQSY